MLPRQIERLKEKLNRWGYPLRLVEYMEPWSLLYHYNYQMKKQERMASVDDDIQGNIRILLDEETAAEQEKEIITYDGARVPYRWRE